METKRGKIDPKIGIVPISLYLNRRGRTINFTSKWGQRERERKRSATIFIFSYLLLPSNRHLLLIAAKTKNVLSLLDRSSRNPSLTSSFARGTRACIPGPASCMNLARGFRGWMNFRGKKKRWRLHASIYGDCTSCSELDNPLHVTRGAQTRRNGSQEDSDPERERERGRGFAL